MSPNHLISEEKARIIISSCEDCVQIASAKSYLELYFKTFNDIESYNFLKQQLELKKIELNCFYD